MDMPNRILPTTDLVKSDHHFILPNVTIHNSQRLSNITSTTGQDTLIICEFSFSNTFIEQTIRKPNSIRVYVLKMVEENHVEMSADDILIFRMKTIILLDGRSRNINKYYNYHNIHSLLVFCY
jgi:hypothetical protein